MTIRICLVKTIPVLCFSLLTLAAFSAPSSPQTKGTSAHSKSKAKANAKPAAKAKGTPKAATKAAAKPTSSGLDPFTLAGMVHAYRDAPSPAHRAAIESYATAHPKDAPLARLAEGVAAYEAKDYPTAIAALRKGQPHLAAIADYTAYYLAASRVESKDLKGIPEELRPVYASDVASPFTGRGWVLQARAMKDDNAPEAVKLLRSHYPELPQPDGDLVLADSLVGAGDKAHAIEIYQKIWSQYLAGDAAARASNALATLQQSMGADYTPPSAQILLHHADRLLETRASRQARTEYRSLAGELTGPDRDVARVRAGEADFYDGGTASAYPYLRQLELPAGEADAERLAFLVECTRRLTDDDEMKSALDRLARQYPHSPWRLKALLSAANRFLLINRPDEYVPLYRAAYQDFPTMPDAAMAHWKVAFQAYLHDDPQAQPLLMEHLRNYPAHATAGGALYFLGRWYERSGDPGAARACFHKLTATWENHYYSMLARAQKPANVPPKAPVADFLASLSFPAARPIPPQESHATEVHIERSRLLRSAGLPDVADAELRFAARTDGQTALLGMEMGESAESPHRALHVMKVMVNDYLELPLSAAPRKFWELLFPLPYRADLDRAASAEGMDPYLMAGLIRQESEFDPQALSSANAYGLAQVRPVTGKQYARKAGVLPFTNRLLFQPSSNLKIGAAILHDMLDHHDGRVEETLAAYNAGPARPAVWITWAEFREPAEFVESIPFTETRDYVQAVMRNADIYRRLYKQ